MASLPFAEAAAAFNRPEHVLTPNLVHRRTVEPPLPNVSFDPKVLKTAGEDGFILALGDDDITFGILHGFRGILRSHSYVGDMSSPLIPHGKWVLILPVLPDSHGWTPEQFHDRTLKSEVAPSPEELLYVLSLLKLSTTSRSIPGFREACCGIRDGERIGVTTRGGRSLSIGKASNRAPWAVSKLPTS